MPTIQGKIKRIIFRNEETGFTVLVLETREEDDIIAVGELFGLEVGDEVSIDGDFSFHPAYGKRFEAKFGNKILPHSEEGIIEYLSSGRVPGVGERRARQIVKALGTDCLRLIAEDPSCLQKVKGLGKKRAEKISEVVKNELGLANFISTVAGWGITPNTAYKIYERYGIQGIERIKEDPYELTELKGIGFKKADKIAEKLGIFKNFPSRIRSGIKYVLEEATNSGHTYLPKDRLIYESVRLLEVDEFEVEEQLENALKDGQLLQRGEKVYLMQYYEEEKYACELLKTLLVFPPNPVNASEAEIERIEKELGIAYTEEQRLGILGALSNKITIITGGPGTGKTTILRGLLRLLSLHDIRVELAAPTGRAARRITELTGYPAQTIHRMLEYNPQTKSFRRNEFFPLDGDFVIIDEVSMVDISLFVSLLRAVYKQAHLLLIGDADQLPSVGPGRVLLDLIESGLFPVFKLTKIHRQAQLSLIVTNAHRIREGKQPIIRNTRDSDFFFLHEEDATRGAKIIEELVCERLPTKMGFDPISDIQVLTPMYKGETGADNLNARLQARLNPDSPGIKRGNIFFRIGDRVMQTKNNYEKGVFNGELGIIKDLIAETGTIFVLFEHLVQYKGEELEELALAYATTVHKSQGNEYPAVIVPLFFEHYIMLARNLLYTALTRAKRLAIIIGSPRAMAMAVRNERMIERYSGLLDFLTEKTDP